MVQGSLPLSGLLGSPRGVRAPLPQVESGALHCQLAACASLLFLPTLCQELPAQEWEASRSARTVPSRAEQARSPDCGAARLGLRVLHAQSLGSHFSRARLLSLPESQWALWPDICLRPRGEAQPDPPPPPCLSLPESLAGGQEPCLHVRRWERLC